MEKDLLKVLIEHGIHWYLTTPRTEAPARVVKTQYGGIFRAQYKVKHPQVLIAVLFLVSVPNVLWFRIMAEGVAVIEWKMSMNLAFDMDCVLLRHGLWVLNRDVSVVITCVQKLCIANSDGVDDNTSPSYLVYVLAVVVSDLRNYSDALFS